jgi:hypothetical protein
MFGRNHFDNIMIMPDSAIATGSFWNEVANIWRGLEFLCHIDGDACSKPRAEYKKLGAALSGISV